MICGETLLRRMWGDGCAEAVEKFFSLKAGLARPGGLWFTNLDSFLQCWISVAENLSFLAVDFIAAGIGKAPDWPIIRAWTKCIKLYFSIPSRESHLHKLVCSFAHLRTLRFWELWSLESTQLAQSLAGSMLTVHKQRRSNPRFYCLYALPRALSSRLQVDKKDKCPASGDASTFSC